MDGACVAEREDGTAAERPLVLLARQASAGDAAAMSQLLRAVGPKLVVVVRAILGSGHPDIEDAVQQTLIGFVQALPSFRGDCDPTGFGRVIAVRTALAVRRRARVLRSRNESDAVVEELPNDRPSPGEDVLARRRKDLVRSLLAELPPEQAEAFAMRIMLGCTLEEIATQGEVPINTVRSRIRLAKERLKARIEADPVLVDALEVGG